MEDINAIGVALITFALCLVMMKRQILAKICLSLFLTGLLQYMISYSLEFIAIALILSMCGAMIAMNGLIESE